LGRPRVRLFAPLLSGPWEKSFWMFMTRHKFSLVFLMLLCASPYLLNADNPYSTTALASSRYRVILSFLQPVQGLARPTTKRSKGTLFRIFKTMCTCKEMQAWGGMHAHNASKMGLSNDSGIGMENCDPQSKTPPESGRRTHLLYFTYSYCILSRVLSLFACFTSLWTFISIPSLILHVTSSRYCSYFLKIHHFHYTFTHAHM